MLRAVEGVRRGLVDRQGACVSGRVRLLAGMHLPGFERPIRGRIGLGVDIVRGHRGGFLLEVGAVGSRRGLAETHRGVRRGSQRE